MVRDLFLDCGAFTAYTVGGELDPKEYIKFVHLYKRAFHVYAGFDFIGRNEGSRRKTYELAKKMVKQGLDPVVVFHSGEDYKWLDRYCEEFNYICIGGVAGGIPKGGTAGLVEIREGILKHMDTAWSIICDSKNGMPRCKVHGLGVSTIPLLFRYPWTSVDSSSAQRTSMNGKCYIPQYVNGELDYTQYTLVHFSTRGQIFGETNRFELMRKDEKKRILHYLKQYKIGVGKSIIKKVSTSHILRNNERKVGTEKGKMLIEVIKESGLSNDHIARYIINVHFFHGLIAYINTLPIEKRMNFKRSSFRF